MAGTLRAGANLCAKPGSAPDRCADDRAVSPTRPIRATARPDARPNPESADLAGVGRIRCSRTTWLDIGRRVSRPRAGSGGCGAMVLATAQAEPQSGAATHASGKPSRPGTGLVALAAAHRAILYRRAGQIRCPEMPLLGAPELRFVPRESTARREPWSLAADPVRRASAVRSVRPRRLGCGAKYDDTLFINEIAV